MLLLPFKIAFKLISYLVAAIVIYLVVSAVQVLSAARTSASPADLKPASAIVVLGAPAPGSVAGSSLVDRLTTGAALYRAHLAPRIVVTGYGDPVTALTVISAARTWLGAHNVPGSAVVTVSASDAASGLKGAATSLGANAPVIVVTNAVDVLWTRGASAKAGLKAQVVPATGTKKNVDTTFGPIVREASGVAAGRIVGYLNVPWAAR